MLDNQSAECYNMINRWRRVSNSCLFLHREPRGIFPFGEMRTKTQEWMDFWGRPETIFARCGQTSPVICKKSNYGRRSDSPWKKSVYLRYVFLFETCEKYAKVDVFIKPGGTAGAYIDPVPADIIWDGIFVFSVTETTKTRRKEQFSYVKQTNPIQDLYWRIRDAKGLVQPARRYDK